MSESTKTPRLKKPKPIFPEIIVKFREGGELTEKNGRLHAKHLSLARFYHTLEGVKGAEVRRSFPTDSARLHEMHAKASRNLRRSIPNLALFVRIRLHKETNVEALIKQLREDPEVEHACLAGTPAPPPSTPDFSGQQDYEDTSPDGVDAPYAWFFPGGNGAGVQVCDCEYGFNQNHEDLPPVVVISNRGNNLTLYEYHGTAVLGELAGIADTKGVTGICPGATILFASESNQHRLDCINDAINALVAGDVLVLEMQTGPGAYKPAEYDTDIHAAVLTAVGLGIVVVAAAGNGSINLTTTPNSDGKHIWDPSSSDYNDSGAIIVGAGGSILNTHPHSKLALSNYGARVNCQGWGQDIVTTGTGDLYNGGANANYTDSFGTTSGATPIVAGAVACLQGAANQALGAPLSPATVRTLLADPTNGTPQADSPTYPSSSYHIGPLPDLRRVLRSAGIYPNVFMRDNVNDTGTEPYIGPVLCWSPDIIARKQPEPDPSTAFGLATWGDAYLGEKIELGQDNYVYVRMNNQGTAPDDVTVSVYWTDASSFIHPNMWNPLGSLAVNNVLPGEHRVAGPIIWPKNQVPPIGHYCIIAVVNSARDPITIPGAFSSSTEYMDFIRNHNNICYHNMDVEDVLPDTPAPPYAFLARGFHDRSTHFRLEIRHRLPKEAIVEVEVAKQPKQIEHMELKKARQFQAKYPVAKTLFTLKDQRPLILDKIPLKRNAAIPVEIRVRLPKGTPYGDYLIHADQYLDKAHLGRVNYMLRVGERKPKRKK